MKVKKIESLINLFISFYILSLYIFNYRTGYTIYSNFLALLLIIFLLIYSFIKKNFLLTNYHFAYLFFIMLSLISTLFAVSVATSAEKVSTIVQISVLVFLLSDYLDSIEKILKVFKYFAVSGLLTSFYIILNEDFSTLTRFGSSLGNVNSIGAALSFSFFFSAYLYKYYSKIYFVPMLFSLSFVVLSGSRKSLLMIIIFILIILIKLSKNPTKIVKNILLTIIVVYAFIYLVNNNELLYLSIGRRIESMFGFLNNSSTDESLTIRLQMITSGLEWFYERPIFGYGWDNYRVLLFDSYGYSTYSHNNFLEILVSGGLLGFISFYYIYYYVYKILAKEIKKEKNTLLIFLLAMLISEFISGFSGINYDKKHDHILILLAYSTIKIVSNPKYQNNRNEIVSNQN